MVPDVITRWLAFLESADPALLDDLLADDVTFCSPAVFTPQEGRAKTTAYLLAAEKMFADTGFHYVEHWYNDRSAILQFRAELDGIFVEGIDMIHWSEDGKIVSFTVMIRPLKALQTVIPRMGQLLQAAAD
ncbi:MAG: nuclear transport factor 2 family protein [Mycobacterium sp.]|nr:nuclear transport factor 2 family protein [Mycobacterium sp.]